jgi:hypothetical protein
MSEKANDSFPVAPPKKDVPQVNRAASTVDVVEAPKNPESIKKTSEKTEKP